MSEPAKNQYDMRKVIRLRDIIYAQARGYGTPEMEAEAKNIRHEFGWGRD